jgi:transcriptional regulator with XRE-family HTH domain
MYKGKGGEGIEKARDEWSRECLRRMIDQRVTVDDLAKALGLSRRYVSTIVQGYTSPESTRRK